MSPATSAASEAMPRSAPIATAPSDAEATSSGSGSSAGCERSIEAELAQALDRRGRLVLGEEVHQLVPYPGA